jgi:hypothetical protein
VTEVVSVEVVSVEVVSIQVALAQAAQSSEPAYLALVTPRVSEKPGTRVSASIYAGSRTTLRLWQLLQ